ncbi:hypothetical protein VP01_6672g2 [Puccinia sorghi]|uniref:Uncharacterized protein n=1 Tax=Puccinia sorghi TaxID=27349 RepID=A0A0L6UH20_9BASI|nr:hypothetical protein VP01_6672g2 [Puccinia sorghi]
MFARASGARASGLIQFSCQCDAIQTLEKARKSCMKVGKHMIHLSDFNIRYVHSSLSKLGRITAQDGCPENIPRVCRWRCLYLHESYKHYVHFTWFNTFNKERKEEGKHSRDEKRKLLQTPVKK